jgi:hypothetical protein
MKEMSKMEKRNTLHLDPPSPDTEENRKSVVENNKKFGKTVVWNTFEVVENLVAGTVISTANPVDKFLEIKDGISAQMGVNSEHLGVHVEPDDKDKDEPEPDVDSVKIPEDLVCPHCGSKARTETSYLKNHGDNCLHKL